MDLIKTYENVYDEHNDYMGTVNNLYNRSYDQSRELFSCVSASSSNFSCAQSICSFRDIQDRSDMLNRSYNVLDELMGSKGTNNVNVIDNNENLNTSSFNLDEIITRVADSKHDVD